MFTTLDADFLLTFIINTSSVIALVIGCYMRKFVIGSARVDKLIGTCHDHASSFLLFGVGVFIVTNLLHSVEISMGFAFGLFAVFSMLRYRTESISVKEMTYLFLVIAISLLSAVSNLNPLELMVLHSIIFVSALICESLLTSPTLQVQQIQYERIENIKPQHYQQLMSDLKLRTGLNIQSVEVDDIDFLRDTAKLRVFHLPIIETKACTDEQVAPVSVIP